MADDDELTFGDRLERKPIYSASFNSAIFIRTHAKSGSRWAHAIYRRPDGSWYPIYINLDVWKKVDRWSVR